MKIYLILLSLLTTTIKADTLSVHCPLGCPSNPESNDLVFKHLYAFSNNPKTKFADWVAYEVDIVNFGDSPNRKWKVDPLLDDNETLEQDDYKGANQSELKADRGHQAPLASFAGSRYWSELNVLSNITPQNKNLNQGAWKVLEEAVRTAVSYRKSLFVITGTIYDGAPIILPNADEPHRVPSSYFKIVYDNKGNSSSFLMKQTANRSDNFCSKQQSLSEIQAKLSFSLPTFYDNGEIATRLGC